MKPEFSPRDEEIIKTLRELASHKASYPPELLAARRAAFMEQVTRGEQAAVKDGLTLKDEEIIRFLQDLKSVEAEYPSKLLIARRAALRRQIAHLQRVRFWDKVRSTFQRRVAFPTGNWSVSLMNFVLTSLIVVSVTAFAGFLIYGSVNPPTSLAASPNGIAQGGPIAATTTPDAPITCKPGYVPPLCLAKEFNKSQDLTYVGNGAVRPAVAKDTSQADGGIYKAAHINDGLYGPGASWVSDSPNSWIKIDLGKPTTINTVKFGRDRLGKLKDRNPGQFVIALALSDNVYANGNSSNDNMEYRQVFNSEQANFSGVIAGTETVTAQFKPQTARYLKITFEQAGTAVDEVEAFLVKPSPAANPTKAPGGEVLLKTATPMPTNTPLPTNTPVPPTDTPLPPPTDTPVPPTDTPVPPPTDTPLPPPTDTPIPPTDTPLPPPTDTPLPADTPVPPIDTPLPFPTDTSVPAAAETSVPINTPVPTDIPDDLLLTNSIYLTML